MHSIVVAAAALAGVTAAVIAPARAADVVTLKATLTHKAAPPAGDVHKTALIPFTANTTNRKGCVAAKEGALQLVLADPGSYYVSVGTSGSYRFAALGGRLHRG
jgi:hypothetical protein